MNMTKSGCLYHVYPVSEHSTILWRYPGTIRHQVWTWPHLTQHVPAGSLQSSCRSQKVPGAPSAASFLHRPYVHWPLQHWPFWVHATFSFRQWTHRNMWQYLPWKKKKHLSELELVVYHPCTILIGGVILVMSYSEKRMRVTIVLFWKWPHWHATRFIYLLPISRILMER